MTTEQRLFNEAMTLYHAANTTPNEQQTLRAAADWACDILDGRATPADFYEAIKDTIIDTQAERQTA